jgi:hypothetical protein
MDARHEYVIELFRLSGGGRANLKDEQYAAAQKNAMDDFNRHP